MIRIFLVERDRQSRSALREFFARFDDLQLVDEAASADEALQKLRANAAFDVVLVNLRSDDIAPIALTRQLRALHPQTRVLMFASAEEPETIFNAMDAGADAYVLKGTPDQRLEAAIRSIRLGTVWLDPGIAQQILEIMATATETTSTRILPTGVMKKPLMVPDAALLREVAASSCEGGLCLVDPAFISKLKRYAPTPA